jgi:predicted metal-dependent hydrolase
VADCLEHPADLPVLPFGELDDDVGLARRAFEDADRRGGGNCVFSFRTEHAPNRDDVAADDRVAGLGEPVGETGVARQQQEAGRREVETADGHEAVESSSISGRAQAVEDGLATLRIALRRDDAARFVQEHETPGRAIDAPTVDRDLYPFRDDEGARVGGAAAIHLDAPPYNQFTRFGPGRNPEFRQRAVEGHLHSIANPQSDNAGSQPVLPFGRPASAGASQTLKLGARVLVVYLVRDARARRYVLRVNHDGTLRLTLPRWGSLEAARRFARGERQWIERERARLLRRAAPSISPEERATLKRRAHLELPARLRKLAAQHGFEAGRVTIRDQRSRWGSCSPNGDISLNWRLIRMPEAVRDYVLLHELAHLREPNHSRRFWRLMSRICPGWREARQWLREHAGA